MSDGVGKGGRGLKESFEQLKSYSCMTPLQHWSLMDLNVQPPHPGLDKVINKVVN